MTLELFGWILMAIGLVLFVYGYLKASKRIEVEDLPRVTEQEKREAFKVAAILPVAQALIDDGSWPVVRVRARLALYDWQDSGDFA